jgi:hypothetical protein
MLVRGSRGNVLQGSLTGGLVALLVAISACSSSGSAATGSATETFARPSSTGRLTIVSPTNGQVIRGTHVVHVQVKLTGAQVVPATTTDITPDRGHLHISLDGAIVSMNLGLTDDLTDVGPGIHTLQVEFVASDHLPFDPRVIEQVTFEVRP